MIVRILLFCAAVFSMYEEADRKHLRYDPPSRRRENNSDGNNCALVAGLAVFAFCCGVACHWYHAHDQRNPQIFDNNYKDLATSTMLKASNPYRFGTGSCTFIENMYYLICKMSPKFTDKGEEVSNAKPLLGGKENDFCYPNPFEYLDFLDKGEEVGHPKPSLGGKENDFCYPNLSEFLGELAGEITTEGINQSPAIVLQQNLSVVVAATDSLIKGDTFTFFVIGLIMVKFLPWQLFWKLINYITNWVINLSKPRDDSNSAKMEQEKKKEVSENLESRLNLIEMEKYALSFLDAKDKMKFIFTQRQKNSLQAIGEANFYHEVSKTEDELAWMMDNGFESEIDQETLESFKYIASMFFMKPLTKLLENPDNVTDYYETSEKERELQYIANNQSENEPKNNEQKLKLFQREIWKLSHLTTKEREKMRNEQLLKMVFNRLKANAEQHKEILIYYY